MDPSCVDNFSSCGDELRNWDMCSDPYFKENCKRSCCECGCDS